MFFEHLPVYLITLVVLVGLIVLVGRRVMAWVASIAAREYERRRAEEQRNPSTHP